MKKHEPKVHPVDVCTELRQNFEDDIRVRFGEGKQPNLQRSKAGCYIDRDIQCWWNGYKLANESIHLVKRKTHPLASRYIIGRIEGTEVTQRFRLSPVPYRHKARLGAELEAKRLVEEHGQPFAIFRCVEVINPPAEEAVE